MAEIVTTSIKSLPLVYRGKVRDSYAVGDDKLLIVASDRISAFDVILGDPIPKKGKILTALTDFWVKELGGIVEVIRKPEADHHPHCLENPQPIVDFIERYRDFSVKNK